jgi:hypothetical protein
MNKFTDENAKQIVAEFLKQRLSEADIGEESIYYETYDVITDSIDKFLKATDEENEQYNFWEQLRWLYVVLGEFVGDDKRYPETWK